MPKLFIGILFLVFMVSCKEPTKNDLQPASTIPIQGTWKLLAGTLIEKGDTTITDYTKDLSFIKIINNSHFSFLQHDTRKDSTNFSAGGGKYELKGNTYTEHLEYCSAKEWEGHDFTFTVTIVNDTLIQTGVEKIEAQGIDRVNTEKYIRYKQTPSCKSLQTGSFKAVTKETGTTFINRTKTEQIEKNDLLGYELIFDIKWINECIYELRPKKLIKGDPAILGNGNIVLTVRIKEITAKTYTAETSSNLNKDVRDFLIEILE